MLNIKLQAVFVGFVDDAVPNYPVMANQRICTRPTNAYWPRWCLLVAMVST